MNEQQAILFATAAKHVESGKLGHKVFDFGRFNFNEDNPGLKNICGTHGCVAGELPILHPSLWKFADDGMPYLIGEAGDISDDLMEFYGIDFDERSFLFFPQDFEVNSEQEYFHGRPYLPDTATRQQVADNMWWFLEFKGFDKNKLLEKIS